MLLLVFGLGVESSDGVFILKSDRFQVVISVPVDV